MRLSRTLPLAFGTILLFLALLRARTYWEEHRMSGARLVLILIKDQVLYFAS